MQTFRWTHVAAATTLALVAVFGPAASARAQLEQFGLGGNAGLDESPITVSAVIAAPTGDQPAKLVVTAVFAPGWHGYSITQPPGGPIRTQIKITQVQGVVVGLFQPIEPPDVHPEKEFNNLLVEEHSGTVNWVAPLWIREGTDIAKLEISGKVYAQACEKVCRPAKDHPFTAKVGPVAMKLPTLKMPDAPPPAVEVSSAPPPPPGNAPPPPPSSAPPAPLGGLKIGNLPPLPSSISGAKPAAPPADAVSIGTFKSRTGHITWNGQLEPSAVAPGGKAKLSFTAELPTLWHVYAIDALQKAGNQPTIILLEESGGLKAAPPQPDQAAIPPHGPSAFPGARAVPYFEKQVTWTIEVDVPATTTPGEYRLAGVLGFQTCDRGSKCDPPEAVRFETTLLVGPMNATAPPTPIRFVKDPELNYFRFRDQILDKPETASGPTTGYDIAQLQIKSSGAASPLPVMLGIGLLAGFILNFMPCVLPVIGLKVLSFVEQGGHDRRRVFLLNAWYSLGILTVFWILATIPVVLRIGFGTQFGWGQQFSYDGFNITLVAIVFVMALSFLGVWEIPIPGFAGGGGAQKAAAKEGAIGAFVKGMITTVLATPCSGPFLGTAVAFAFGSSAPVTYAMFTAMGLGMAAPYLLIGLKPGLVKFLPKPGEWMDTFKQLMGFVLVGTVLWLMLPIDPELLMPTLALLAGLAAACWWIGRTPGYAELPQKLKAWTQASVFAGVIGWLAFATPQVTDPLPWKHFKMAEFVRDVNSGKTVLVECTADWCLTCKTLKAANLDREKTKNLVTKNNVVVYEMDVDKATEEEKAFFLKMQHAGSVPLIAIFPSEKKYEPISFGDGYTQGQILSALDEAGPSKPDTTVADRGEGKIGLH